MKYLSFRIEVNDLLTELKDPRRIDMIAVTVQKSQVRSG